MRKGPSFILLKHRLNRIDAYSSCIQQYSIFCHIRKEKVEKEKLLIFCRFSVRIVTIFILFLFLYLKGRKLLFPALFGLCCWCCPCRAVLCCASYELHLKRKETAIFCSFLSPQILGGLPHGRESAAVLCSTAADSLCFVRDVLD